MARPKSEGIIIVRFPPPVPKDFGRTLRQTVMERLAKWDECSTANTGSLGGPPGWAFDIRIKRARDTETAAAVVAERLRGQPLAAGATMEVSERRGPVTISPGGGDWIEGLLFPDGTDAWADLYLTLPSSLGERDTVVAAADAAIGPFGRVTHAVKLSTLNLTVLVEDAQNLVTGVESLFRWLNGAGGTLCACTQSHPVVSEVA